MTGHDDAVNDGWPLFRQRCWMYMMFYNVHEYNDGDVMIAGSFVRQNGIRMDWYVQKRQTNNFSSTTFASPN